MNLEKFDFKLDQKKIPFYFKKVPKEGGYYFYKIINGDIYKKIDLGKKVNLILDLGANYGAASFCFAIRYPDATILSLEAAPETFKILELNTKSFKNIIPFNLAASDISGISDIYIDTNKMGRSSLIKNHLGYNFDLKQKTKTINFMSFIKENNIEKIDILKIDVEGSEYKVINSIKNFLSNVGLIYIEMHGNKKIDNLRNLILKSHIEYETKNHRDNLSEAIFINENYK